MVDAPCKEDNQERVCKTREVGDAMPEVSEHKEPGEGIVLTRSLREGWKGAWKGGAGGETSGWRNSWNGFCQRTLDGTRRMRRCGEWSPPGRSSPTAPACLACRSTAERHRATMFRCLDEMASQRRTGWVGRTCCAPHLARGRLALPAPSGR